MRAASLVASLCLVSTWAAGAQEPRKVVFGLLHAHTSYSDGVGTPREAFRMARDAGLQFFAVTEHNHLAAEQLLLRAAKTGLPVYTVGLRMLLDGLRMIGEIGRPALARLQADGNCPLAVAGDRDAECRVFRGG